MLTNVEYANAHQVPVDLSPEMEEMAMFTIDMGQMKVCVGRNANGKRILKNAFPHLKGKHLWDLAPRKGMTIAQAQAIEAKEKELDRKARLELYITQGYQTSEETDTIEMAELED